ncbi:TerC family protein [Swaminathania salitolerans]|uniref:Membrane protein n=1 Tax=Swaminathania salitolerans TaxID=182838 RepID=A0A511BNQ0_9PROT|nr:TerC family protein [Swaminathania salitolerans]GBQ13925.1 integral membrane protein TerC [Swaminathania salitolerans LMG 21291]GEL01692.1 membrane protein [Swaminathania salitolerans]
MAPDLTWHALIALAQVVMIDITLAGDNAVVIGMVVRGLPARQRRIAIAVGVLAAAVMRILLALVASRLLAVIGLTLAGGILLLWVCWKMYQELVSPDTHEEAERPGSLGQAIFRIVLADLSMSLDNVLAVAGAAIGHPYILVTGLALSVLLMGVAASLVARLLERYRWIAWLGLAIVAFVAIELIWKGSAEVIHHVLA